MAPLLVVALGLAGPLACSDAPIGQPCNFTWPVKPDPTDPTGQRTVPDCSTFPGCQPLQAGSVMGAVPLNDACPVDCIQLPSLQCTNLICVATQADEAEGQQPYNVMNGKCAPRNEENPDIDFSECAGEGAQFGCAGYCTKECLSDSSCPKGYRCSPMAPFGENVRCEDEDLWGDGGGDQAQRCTDNCLPTGTQVGTATEVCPSSRAADGAAYDYAKCDQKIYQSCCACMCYRYCPLLTKKFCRKVKWDTKMFPLSVTTNGSCKPAD